MDNSSDVIYCVSLPVSKSYRHFSPEKSVFTGDFFNMIPIIGLCGLKYMFTLTIPRFIYIDKK